MKQVTFKDSTGKDVLSKGILYTKADIKLEDRITYDTIKFTVAQVCDTIDIGGILQFHKVY
ncbi:hypothetical protein M3M33_16340, partial [Loigolactobacillus coryniformis]|uniref:hypothetical protein n=1 Tax=Loigolactobacillus coryniformis TaxID=1610 RepID=UPI00201A96D1